MSMKEGYRMHKGMKIFVNSLTTSRFILAIVFMFLLNKIGNIPFLISICVLFLTDTIDGFLARKFHIETYYGSLMDTLADKALNIALLLPLIKMNGYYISILILEVITMVINLSGLLLHKEIKAKMAGKIKMWIVSIAIVLGYISLFNYLPKGYINYVILVTNFFQVYVLVDYMLFLHHQKIGNINFEIKGFKDFVHKLFDTEFYLEKTGRKK